LEPRAECKQEGCALTGNYRAMPDTSTEV